MRKISPPPVFDPQTVQSVASRYTDCGIPAHLIRIDIYFNDSVELCRYSFVVPVLSCSSLTAVFCAIMNISYNSAYSWALFYQRVILLLCASNLFLWALPAVHAAGNASPSEASGAASTSIAASMLVVPALALPTTHRIRLISAAAEDCRCGVHEDSSLAWYDACKLAYRTSS